MPPRLPKHLATLARRHGVVRAKDLAAARVPRRELSRLVASGAVRHEARGVYSFTAHGATEKHSLAVAAVRVPRGVICLLSALVFHGLTTQNPWEVWIAVDFKARKPADPSLPLRVVRFSGLALRRGIEQHQIEGVPVRVYSLAKTVADLFKYRHKVGTDVAVEALREALRARRTTRGEVAEFARVCRVLNVTRPYLESV